MPFVRFPIALATLLLATPPLVPTSVAQSPAAPLALTGATIYPSPDQPAIRNGVVLLRDGRIAAVGRHGEVTVPRGTDTLDCTGLTVTAGFWNSHVHSPATASPACSKPARPCGIPSRSTAAVTANDRLHLRDHLDAGGIHQQASRSTRLIPGIGAP
jgi:imidazolonepropionase-like amidohydrolase